MILRKLLAALILLTLIAGHPMAAPAAGAECETAAAAGAFCGAGETWNCTLACSTAPAAVVEASAQVLPLRAGAPLDCATLSPRSFSLAPDTAPPKAFRP